MKILKTAAIFVIFLTTAHAKFRANFSEQIGDVLALMPLYMGIASVGMKDFVGARELFYGALSTQISIEILKKSLNFAHNRGARVDFARRPAYPDYEGFPSGHAGGAFSAAAHMYFRYGFQAAILPIFGAIFTAYSRVEAGKHSVLQVVSGSSVAIFFAWLFTDNFSQNIVFFPEITENRVKISIKYDF